MTTTDPRRVTGIDGYEATQNYHLWFRSYDTSRGMKITHSVHILVAAEEPGCFGLVDLWQGPLSKLISDAVAQGFLRQVADTAPVQLDLFGAVA